MDIWKTRDGRQIPVQLLSDKHLLNIYKELIDAGNYSPAEREMLGIRGESDTKKWYEIIKQEVERRQLKLNGD